MNKKKALLLHEFRKRWWICLVGVITALVGDLVLGSSLILADGAENYFYDAVVPAGSRYSASLVWTIQTGHHVLVFAIALLTLLVYMELHNRKSQEYLQSLPYTRKQLFFAKTGLMYGYITLSWLVFSAGALIIRAMEIDSIQYNSLLSPAYEKLLANETLGHTIRSLVLFWLILLALYTVFLMVHSLVNSSGLASLMSVGVISAPHVLAWTVNQFYNMFTGKSIPGYESMARLSDMFWGNATYIQTEEEEVYAAENLYIYFVSYDKVGWQYILSVVVLLAALWIAWKATKKYDLAKDRSLVSVTWARRTFAAGMGVCFASLFGVGIGWSVTSIQWQDYSTLGYSVLGTMAGLVVLLAGSAGFYALFHMLLKRKTKQ